MLRIKAPTTTTPTVSIVLEPFGFVGLSPIASAMVLLAAGVRENTIGSSIMLVALLELNQRLQIEHGKQTITFI